MTAQPLQKSWRNWFRLSVRGLIVLVLVIGVWLGWFVRSASVQRESVAALNKAGGYVRYQSDTLNRMSPRLRWLVYYLGVDDHDYFDRVYEARVWNDAALEHAGRLSTLVRLECGRTSVTDAGLVHLEGLKNLSFLDLEETNVSDAGLRHLKGLKSLSALSLRGTRVTDAGLKHLEGLTSLRLLTIRLAWRPAGGPLELQGPTRSSNLGPNEPQVTAAGIKELLHALPHLTICRY
jgi:internalin A